MNPSTPNTTCDIYHNGSSPPPAAPDISAVWIFLSAQYEIGLGSDQGATTEKRFTHLATMDDTVAIKDSWNKEVAGATADTIYVPDKNGTPFKVIFVEPILPGTPQSHYRVFLSRMKPTWPTQEL